MEHQKNTRSVLIVDDENDICFLFGKMLKENHYNVTIANNISECIVKLKEVKPSILFLDIRLPDGSGLDAVHDIRQQNPQMKIIIMSAYDGTSERKQAAERGADFFIGKPLNNDMIRLTLESIDSKPEKY